MYYFSTITMNSKPSFVKCEIEELSKDDKILFRDSDTGQLTLGKVIKSITESADRSELEDGTVILPYINKGVSVHTRSGITEVNEVNYFKQIAPKQFKRLGFYDVSVGDTIITGFKIGADRKMRPITAKITEIRDEVEPSRQGKFFEICTYMKKTIICDGGDYTQTQQFLMKETKFD